MPNELLKVNPTTLCSIYDGVTDELYMKKNHCKILFLYKTNLTNQI